MPSFKSTQMAFVTFALTEKSTSGKLQTKRTTWSELSINNNRGRFVRRRARLFRNGSDWSAQLMIADVLCLAWRIDETSQTHFLAVGLADTSNTSIQDPRQGSSSRDIKSKLSYYYEERFHLTPWSYETLAYGSRLSTEQFSKASLQFQPIRWESWRLRSLEPSLTRSLFHSSKHQRGLWLITSCRVWLPLKLKTTLSRTNAKKIAEVMIEIAGADEQELDQDVAGRRSNTLRVLRAFVVIFIWHFNL